MVINKFYYIIIFINIINHVFVIGNANGETPNGNNAAQTNHDHSKEHQANPNKHRSVLQAKLTSLVIKISYAGKI